jgi:hypothetical protein
VVDEVLVASCYFRTYHPRVAASCFARTGRALSALLGIELFESNYDLSKAEIQAATNQGRLPD